jgi:fructose-1,6-bisphosphatase/inositol monophosphatase family enzyme
VIYKYVYVGFIYCVAVGDALYGTQTSKTNKNNTPQKTKKIVATWTSPKSPV